MSRSTVLKYGTGICIPIPEAPEPSSASWLPERWQEIESSLSSELDRAGKRKATKLCAQAAHLIVKTSQQV